MMTKPIIAPVMACLPLSVFSALPALETTMKPPAMIKKKRMTPAIIKILGRMVETRVPRSGKTSFTGCSGLSLRASPKSKPKA